MNITLFGGSFNPPHLGHEIVLKQIFELKLIPNLDQIWLLPEYQHSFAKNTDLAPANHRLAMTRFLLNHKIKIETCCIDKQMSGNTIEHITYLQKTYPQHFFSFLIGSDNLAGFTQWPQWQKLLKLMVFYIYPRLDCPFKPLYPNMKPLTHPQQIITNISSTMIRQRISQGLPVEHLLPGRINRYLTLNRLYQPL
jgi:nicotinate-nucleotide adenylyltransferase